MEISDKGLVEIVGHEGISLSKYKDSVGVWTIGIGATKTEIPDIASWPLKKTISIEEAFNLLRKSIKKYEKAINDNLKVSVTQYQFDALCSWCYNVGVGWAKKASVMSLINKGITGSKLADALLKFNRPSEILGRRRKEAKLLSTGEYSNRGQALLFPVSGNGYPMYKKATIINVWEHLPVANPSPPLLAQVAQEDEVSLEDRPSLLGRLQGLWRSYHE